NAMGRKNSWHFEFERTTAAQELPAREESRPRLRPTWKESLSGNDPKRDSKKEYWRCPERAVRAARSRDSEVLAAATTRETAQHSRHSDRAARSRTREEVEQSALLFEVVPKKQRTRPPARA